MFKKIEIWILYLVILLGIVSAVGFGVLVRQELVGSIKAGWVSKTALTLAEIPVNLKRVSRGLSGDLSVEDRFPTLDGFNGNPNSEESYLLLSRYDGDLEEGVVELVDLDVILIEFTLISYFYVILVTYLKTIRILVRPSLIVGPTTHSHTIPMS